MNVEDWKTFGLCISAAAALFFWVKYKAIQKQAKQYVQEEIKKYQEEEAAKKATNTATSPE